MHKVTGHFISAKVGLYVHMLQLAQVCGSALNWDYEEGGATCNLIEANASSLR